MNHYVMKFTAFALMSFIGGALLPVEASASELRYRPMNPSFGGDSFNSNHLLGTAQAQNDFEPPEEPEDLLGNFERTITSSLISRISFQIADQILGENAQESGQYTLGDTIINFQRTGNTVEVTLVDGITGQRTTLEVPTGGL
jgi:curli production assembly/transport component CsgF